MAFLDKPFLTALLIFSLFILAPADDEAPPEVPSAPVTSPPSTRLTTDTKVEGPAVEDPNKPVVDQIYDRLKSLFGNGDQLFSMEFPGRVLDEATYLYNISDSTSQYLKPQAVAEAEFRLTDALFDVSQIMSGPNGEALSTVYEQALNQFVPKWQSSQYRKDRETTRSWLLTETSAPSDLSNGDAAKPGNIDCKQLMSGFDNLYTAYSASQKPSISVMDLHTKLTTRYNEMKLTWSICKVSEMEKAIATPSYRDDFFRWVSVVGQSAESKINSYWEDLVVRGYHHEVQEALSLIDRTSVAELIEEARNKMRTTSTTSIDGSTTLYPVQMQPDNWAQSLSTHFTPKDLLMDYDSLVQQVNQLQEQINQLTLQKSLLESAKTGDVESLEAEVEKQRKVVADAQTDMVKEYGSSVATIAKMYLTNKYGNDGTIPEGDTAAVKTDLDNNLKEELGEKPPITPAQVDELLGQWNQTAEAQQQLTQSNEALTRLSAALAAAHTSDFASAITQLSEELQSSSQKMTQLTNMLEVVGKDASENPGSKNITFTPSMPDPGPWTQVTMAFKSSTKTTKSSLSESASHKSWNLDLIFASGSGGSSTSKSDSSQSFLASNVDMKIGFQATKVTIDRGGWFMPQVVRNSKDYMRVSGQPISSGPPKSMDFISGQEVANYSSQLFPAYPVALVIARDITIQLTAGEEISDETKSYLHHESSSSGGFLCFSYATSASSTNQASSFHSASVGNVVNIKIPGSQILGWFMEFVPKDEAEDYQGMPPNYWPTVTSESGEKSFEDIKPMSEVMLDAPGPTLVGVAKCETKVVGNTFTSKDIACLKNSAGLCLTVTKSGLAIFSLKTGGVDSRLAHLTVTDGTYTGGHYTCREGTSGSEFYNAARLAGDATVSDQASFADNCCFKEEQKNTMKAVMGYVNACLT